MKQCISILVCFLCIAALAPAEQLTCTVKVVDYNAKPVANAEVAVYEEVWAYMQGRVQLNLLGQIQKTDHDGTLPVNWTANNNSIIIVTRKEGLALDWQRMNRGQLKPNVTLRLDKPSILAGRVVDDAGKPVTGASVWMCLCNDRSGGHTGIPFSFPDDWFSSKTDSDGKFRFTNIAEDTIADFRVESPERATFWTCQERDTQPGRQFSAGRRDIEIVMPPETRIQGRVVDSKGNGIAGIRLLARADKGNANYFGPAPITSGENGRFCIKGLPADTYSLQAVAPEEGIAEWVSGDTKVVCQEGENSEDITITVVKGGIVELIVTDAENDQPLGDFWYSITQQANYGRHPGFGKYGRTNAGGRARIRMPIGPCRVSAGGTGYSFYNLNPAVTVTKDKVSKLEIMLDRDPAISGTVTDQKGRPVSNVFVDVLPTSHGADHTDAKGKFEVSWRSQNASKKMYVLSQDRKNNLAALVEIEDESKPLAVVLKPGLTLGGKITGPEGKPIPVARVQLKANLPGWLTTLGPEVVTDTEGRYEIPAIPPEIEGLKYRISVDATGYASFKNKSFELTKASENRFEDRTFTLKPANLSISGIVVDSDGTPVTGRMLHLAGPNGNDEQPRRTSTTNEKGEFHIDRICSGPLRIQAGYSSDPGGSGFLNANGGDKNVKVITGQKRTHIPYGSVMGKLLPPFDEIKIDFDSKKEKGKKILVCFWDMEQRPSRHCIRELAKQADQLKEKDVVVISVQASKVDKNKLDELVKKYNIPFTTGMITGKEEKTKLKWGVKSLPWLILTDRAHDVKAVGFGLDELEEKLK